MRKLLKNKKADIAMVGAAVAILVSLAVSLLIVYNVIGSIDTSSVDTTIEERISNGVDSSINNSQYAANATDEILENSETFYTIAPLIVVVLAAVVILAYVMRIGKGGA